MSLKYIPAITEITCDNCGKIIEEPFDMQRVASIFVSGSRFDFCKTCFDKMKIGIEKEIGLIIKESPND